MAHPFSIFLSFCLLLTIARTARRLRYPPKGSKERVFLCSDQVKRAALLSMLLAGSMVLWTWSDSAVILTFASFFAISEMLRIHQVLSPFLQVQNGNILLTKRYLPLSFLEYYAWFPKRKISRRDLVSITVQKKNKRETLLFENRIGESLLFEIEGHELRFLKDVENFAHANTIPFHQTM